MLQQWVWAIQLEETIFCPHLSALRFLFSRIIVLNSLMRGFTFNTKTYKSARPAKHTIFFFQLHWKGGKEIASGSKKFTG